MDDYSLAISYLDFPYSFSLCRGNEYTLEIIPDTRIKEQFGDRVKIKGGIVFFKHEDDYLIMRLTYE